MMKCRNGHRVPDNFVTCPSCVENAAILALHEVQLEFLRKAALRAPGYTLRVIKGNGRHVIQYTSQTRTFCGLELKTQPTIVYQPYEPSVIATLCVGCRVEIKHMLEEATAK